MARSYSCIAKCSIPVREKRMDMFAFGLTEGEPDVVALVNGYRRHANHAAIVRFHSACFTGDILGSEKCDCGPQLDLALHTIARSPWGIIVYFLRHEGRGIGLTKKMRAYALQDEGYDTVAANIALHEPIESRDYDAGIAALHYLGATRIWLLTNSPDKIGALRQAGIDVVGAKDVPTPVTAHNRHYLEKKRVYFGHHLVSSRT
jgi:GTP cyclohydrolase II